MQRLSGEEMRQGVIDAQTTAEEAAAAADAAKSAGDHAADEKLRAAFSHRTDPGSTISQKQLRQAYKDGPRRVPTATSRITNSRLPISNQRFQMARDWDPPEENNAQGSDPGANDRRR